MSLKTDRLQLPAEIWLRIFDFATFVPGILETEVQDPFDSPTTLLPHAEYELLSSTGKSSLATKRSLVQVCRDFYWLALPLLYQTVFLGPPKSTSARALRDAYLADILGCLSNLEILSVHTNSLDLYIPHFVVDSLITTSASSLRKLYFERDSGLHLRASDRMDLLDKCPNLRTVSLGDSIACKELCPIDLLRVSEPSFLTISSTPSGCTSRHLEHAPARPSLRHVLFSRYGHSTEHSVDAMCHFLSVQGPYLESIQLDARFTPHDWLQVGLNLFTDYCPRLARLTLILGSTSWRSLSLNGLNLPSVTHLALHFDCRQGPEDFQHLFLCLSNTYAPTLKVVRFLQPRRTRNLKKYVAEGCDCPRGIPEELREAVPVLVIHDIICYLNDRQPSDAVDLLMGLPPSACITLIFLSLDIPPGVAIWTVDTPCSIASSIYIFTPLNITHCITCWNGCWFATYS
ncbi:hypothetical protein EW146_g3356 [Bondarzewia mesenterica]|uniref:F-box domain-containing protein n=1 Tax=Bondarzewia mesenterica TaxID=1095465 RepID=A0A4S4M3P5_9AGAM|nr:hypothetical protein EW146_g3356 [Bondarzewia mesenterica]